VIWEISRGRSPTSLQLLGLGQERGGALATQEGDRRHGGGNGQLLGGGGNGWILYTGTAMEEAMHQADGDLCLRGGGAAQEQLMKGAAASGHVD
jgi:hypothetical protein